MALAIDDNNLLEAGHRNRLFWGIKEKERRAAQSTAKTNKSSAKIWISCAAGVSRPSNVGCKWSRY
jgi:hypothetical protein